MTESRFKLHLLQMQEAAENARQFIDGMTQEQFLHDRRTQHAVAMSLLIIGDHATRAMDRCPNEVAQHQQIPWRMMRGMRNQIAHGYSELDLPAVWTTATTDIPDLLEDIQAALSMDSL